MDASQLDSSSFLSLSPEVGSFFTSPPPPAFTTQDYVFASELVPSLSPPSSSSLDFPQLAHDYPSLVTPELFQLFSSTSPLLPPSDPQIVPQFMTYQDFFSHPFSLAFAPELMPQQPKEFTQQVFPLPSDPSLPSSSWSSYMEEVLSHSLPYQQHIPLPTSSLVPSPAPPHPSSFFPTIPLKHETPSSSSCSSASTSPSPSPSPSPSSSALQKLHSRLLQRLRKSQADCPTPPTPPPTPPDAVSAEQCEELLRELDEREGGGEEGKKADGSFNKVLELFSYYFNTQKTASPLACTAALYLGQVGFELQKRYEAYNRFLKTGNLDESLVSLPRAIKLRKLAIKSYEEFLRAEVSELRRIKDPERYLNRRMQVFQSYEPEELDGVYLSFDALYLLAKKPPTFRKEWLEEGKIRIVHICEIHDAWRACPLNKTKRVRSPSTEDMGDSKELHPSKALKADG